MKKEKVDRLKKKNQEEDVKAQIGVLLYVMLIIISLLFVVVLLLSLLFLLLLLSFVDRYKDANTYPGSTFFNRRK
jgi:ABC-type Na+ efflux pump permease subunit